MVVTFLYTDGFSENREIIGDLTDTYTIKEPRLSVWRDGRVRVSHTTTVFDKVEPVGADIYYLEQ